MKQIPNFLFYAQPIQGNGVTKLYCRLILLRHGRRRPFNAALAPQHGHCGKVLMSARINRARMVATEFGMWRSSRVGGASGSIVVG